MKLKGKKIQGVNFEVIVLPRPDGPIVFKAAAVIDHSDFEKYCPKPKPPMITRRGETVPVPDFTDDEFKKAMEKHGEKRFYFIILQSLAATPDLEWETIKLEDPSTWTNFDQELKDSGITEVERNRIIDAVMTANSLNDKKIEEARKSFLTSPAAG